MPVGAFGGRRDIMEKIAPLGPVYQAGTLSGNPVAVAAGLATLKLMPGARLLRSADRQDQGAGAMAWPRAAQEAWRRRSAAQTVGGMFGLYFAAALPDVPTPKCMACDKEAFNRFFHAMLDAGDLSRAFRLRSRLRLGGAQRCRHRGDGGGCRRPDPSPRLASEIRGIAWTAAAWLLLSPVSARSAGRSG